jgi:predicted Zn-dependent protease
MTPRKRSAGDAGRDDTRRDDAGRGDTERPGFLSESDCHDIASRLTRMAKGGGYTVVSIKSSWTGNVRWARNQISSSGEVLNHAIAVGRAVNGAGSQLVWVNDTDDATLVAATRRAERLAALAREKPQADLIAERPLETAPIPTLFSDATYNLDASRRSQAARDLASSAVSAGMLSAGYLEVSGHGQALIDSLGRSRYFRYTGAQYSVTVRDPKGSGSGWAGIDWYDWNRIDGAGLSKIALQKCLTSRNPVRVEPGRYTTILEPQAVGDFVSLIVAWMDRRGSEGSPPGPFSKGQDPSTHIVYTEIGDKIVDDRITITSDPMDLEAGFPGFDNGYTVTATGDPFEISVFHPTTWVERGVLKTLSYLRDYGIQQLSRGTGAPMNGGFRMSGGTTTIDEMIATTKRGVLVTRFDRTRVIDHRSLLSIGFTRDGLWLVEDGKITHPIKNFAFTESPLFVLNKVEQLGAPQRIFHPGIWAGSNPAPIVVPPMKVSDFSFTSLTDAV